MSAWIYRLYDFSESKYPLLGKTHFICTCIWLSYLLFCGSRDGLDKTIQHTIDGSCAPGIFPLLSIPNLIGCIGAAIIIIAAIATPIAKSQAAREVWFYFMSGGALLKIVVMEVSRIRL